MSFTYRFRDNVHDRSYNTETTAITRSPIIRSGEILKGQLQVSVAGDRAAEPHFAAMHSRAFNLGNIRLDITDDDTNTLVFMGFMKSSKLTNNQLDLFFENPLVGRLTASRKFQRTCPYVLYDQNTCKVNAASHAVDAIVSSINDAGDMITVSAAITNPEQYVNGSLGWDGLRYWIGNVSDDALTITTRTPVHNLQANNTIALQPACDKVLATCRDRFNNIENFGGQPSINYDDSFSTENADAALDFTQDLSVLDLTDEALKADPTYQARVYDEMRPLMRAVVFLSDYTGEPVGNANEPIENDDIEALLAEDYRFQLERPPQ